MAAVSWASHAHVKEYRAFFLNQEGLFSSHGFQAVDDQEALRQARRLVDGHDVEVWQLARKVGLIKYRD